MVPSYPPPRKPEIVLHSSTSETTPGSNIEASLTSDTNIIDVPALPTQPMAPSLPLSYPHVPLPPAPTLLPPVPAQPLQNAPVAVPAKSNVVDTRAPSGYGSIDTEQKHTMQGPQVAVAVLASSAHANKQKFKEGWGKLKKGLKHIGERN